MFNGNPNLPSQPFAPTHYEKRKRSNPYGYGAERTAGQIAVQPQARTGMDLNWFARPFPFRSRGVPMLPAYGYQRKV